MKRNRLFRLFAVLFVSTMAFGTMHAQNPMCMVGDATRYGWDKDKSSPLTQDGVNPSKFYYNAHLNAGSFKFLMQNSDWVPTWNSDAGSATKVVKRNTYSDPDVLFTVATAGNYSIVLDIDALTLSVTPMTETTPIDFNTVFMVGDATPIDWDLANAVELVKNPANPFEFSYTGHMDVGEFKLPVNRNWGWNQDFFMRVDHTHMYLRTENDGLGDNKWSIAEAGDYKITINTKDLTIDIRKLFTWSGNGSWSNTANWSSASLPTADAMAVVSGGELAIDQDVSVNSLIINSGAKLTLNSGKTLSTTNFTINSDATGTGTFVDNGTVNITGTTNVQQYLTAGRNWYFASPVSAAQGSVVLGANGNKLWKYNDQTVAWDPITDASTPLDLMSGYVAKTVADGAITFTGELNTGAISKTGLTRGTTGAKRGFYLLGNPYPSYLDWQSAVTNPVNASSNLSTTIWYRTKNNSNAYTFATYNATGNVGSVINDGEAPVNALIPSMQSFWVRVAADNSTGSLNLNNSMRSHKGATGSLLRSAETTDQQVLRLRVSNGTNSDEAIVLFNPNASDDFDNYDSPKMSNDNAVIPEIYTLAGSEQVVINGLNSIGASKEMALGFKTGETNNFSIQATEISNFDAATTIVLKDKLLNTTTDLTGGTVYNFSSASTNTADRFSVVLSKVTTGIEKTNDVHSVLVYKNADSQIAVKLNGITGQEGTVVLSSALGQEILSTRLTGETTLLNKALNPGIYLVTVRVAGMQTTRKVVIE